jgi:Leucine-rich repeat (LRR) protein
MMKRLETGGNRENGEGISVSSVASCSISTSFLGGHTSPCQRELCNVGTVSEKMTPRIEDHGMPSGQPLGISRSPAKLLLIAMIFPVIAAGQARGGTAPGERVLHFPADRSVGKLMIYTGPVTDPDDIPINIEPIPHSPHWVSFCPARGNVTVPANKLVKLGVGEPHLKDLSYLRKLKADDLYGLNVSGTWGPPFPTQPVLLHLNGLTGLRELSVYNINFRGADLRHLKGLTSLRSIRLRDPDEPVDPYVQYLANRKPLEYLHVECLCSDAGLKGLNGLPALRGIALSSNAIKGPGLAHLETLPALRSLALIGQEFSDQGLAGIRNLKSLTRLRLWCIRGDWEVTDAGLANLSGLTGLEELEFTRLLKATDAGMVHLKPLRSIKRLNLGWARITEKGLAQLGEMKSLESLQWPGGITDGGLSWLARSFKLKELGVSGEQITDEGIRHLAGVRSLECLHLSQTSMTDASMDAIAQLTNLQDLSIYCSPGKRSGPGRARVQPEAGQPGSPLTDEGLAKMTALQSLESLYLRHAKLTISGVSRLNILSNLTYLNVGSVQQDDTVLNLSGLGKLERFTIESARGSRIRDADLACLAQLKNLQDLQIVGTDGNAIGDEGLAHLAGLTNIYRLSIGGNVTDIGLGHLRNLKNLQVLFVAGDFTGEGLRHLEGLKGLHSVSIRSEHPLSRAARNRLQQALPNLYSFQEMKPSRR